MKVSDRSGPVPVVTVMSPAGESFEWMTNEGYGMTSVGAIFDREDDPADRGSARLTDTLGCVHTDVTAHRVTPDHPASVGPDGERLCIPIDGSGTLDADPPLPLPDLGMARLPGGSAALTGTDPVDWLVIGTSVEEATNRRPVVVDLEALDYVEPATSSIRTARLTEPLGCIAMKVNARLLEPGDRVPYHTEGSQEELFVPVLGEDTRMLIDGEPVALPVGSIARVAPRTPRAAVNAGDDDSIWVMVGAPPTGGPDEWDPGAEILPWPDGS